MRLVRATLVPFLFGALTLGACSSDDDETPDTGTAQPDSGKPAEDAGTVMGMDATADNPDAMPGADAEPMMEMDAGTVDTGVPVGNSSFEPGDYVEVAEGRVSVGDSFGAVKGVLGEPDRQSMGMTKATPRSFEWDLAPDRALTVWFADSDLNQMVDDTDIVLWIAIEGAGFTGQSAAGIGIGSSAADVMTAYGAPDRSAPVSDGNIATYFTGGLIVAYDDQNQVRTVTVVRAYPQAPGMGFDIPGGRVNTTPPIAASILLGSSEMEVMQILGPPDGRGSVQVGANNLTVLSYAFIGIEVFALATSQTVVFVSLHAPFYGTTGNGVGIGSLRTDFEAHLSGEGFGMGQPTNANPDVICYTTMLPPMRGVAATFNETAAVTTISVGYPASACP